MEEGVNGGGRLADGRGCRVRLGWIVGLVGLSVTAQSLSGWTETAHRYMCLFVVLGSGLALVVVGLCWLASLARRASSDRVGPPCPSPIAAVVAVASSSLVVQDSPARPTLAKGGWGEGVVKDE